MEGKKRFLLRFDELEAEMKFFVFCQVTNFFSFSFLVSKLFCVLWGKNLKHCKSAYVCVCPIKTNLNFKLFRTKVVQSLIYMQKFSIDLYRKVPFLLFQLKIWIKRKTLPSFCWRSKIKSFEHFSKTHLNDHSESI